MQVPFFNKRFHLITVALILFLFVGGMASPTSANEPTVFVIQAIPGTDCGQLALDYQADWLGVVNALSLCHLQVGDGGLYHNLEADSRVVSVEQDSILEAPPSSFGASGDAVLEAQPRWFGMGGEPGLQYDSQWALSKTRALQAQSLARGQGVIVAVLDTGVDLDHPLFAGKLVAGYDFVDGDDVPDEAANQVDDDGDGRVDEAVGHGTHVAGIVALIAPDAQIMPVRIFNDDGLGAYFDAIEGIVYAVDHGARVINLSGSGPEDSDALRAAVDYAWDHGVLVVASGAANTLGYPALYQHTISVGATDQEDRAADFAVFQEGLPTVYAPGISIYSAYTDGNNFPYQYAYAWWSGNSMAAPFVSGEAALLFSTGNCDRDCAAALIPDTKFPELRSGAPKRIDLYDAVAAATGQINLNVRGQHKTGASTSINTNTTLRPHFNVVNQGNTIPLSDLTIRYWYTGGPQPQVYNCEQAAVGCEHVTGQIVHLNWLRPGADQYLEIGFTGDAGYLLGGRSSGEIENQIARTDQNYYNELNDYSFSFSQMYLDWYHVTVYHQGNLVWGREP